MADLNIPFFHNNNMNQQSTFSNNELNLIFKCSYCNKKIKCAPLKGCKRMNNDFMCINDNFKILYFCDFICAKLYDNNVQQISIDVKKYRIDFLNKRLSKEATIIYNRVSQILFTQLPTKKCLPITKEDFEIVRTEYLKIL